MIPKDPGPIARAVLNRISGFRDQGCSFEF
jgi:hypothetical protein